MSEPPRILTTHVGSLPRPPELVEFVFAEDRGEDVDRGGTTACSTRRCETASDTRSRPAIDFVSDGEMSKIGYATYIRHRLSGFEVGDVPRATPADLDAYPRYMKRLADEGGSARYLRPICRGPIAYEHREPLQADLARLTRARRPARPGRVHERAVARDHRAVPAERVLPQPGRVPGGDRRGDEGRVRGDRGGRLHAPDRRARSGHGPPHHVPRPTPTRSSWPPPRGTSRRSTTRCANVPADRVRLHLCWGNYEGPHHLDIGVEKIIDVVLRAKPATILFEAANPRHEHEWAIVARGRDPGRQDARPGRPRHDVQLHRAPRAGGPAHPATSPRSSGPTRVMAGTDCGFGTWSGFGSVDPDICWAKLASLAEGARRASERA